MYLNADYVSIHSTAAYAVSVGLCLVGGQEKEVADVS